MVARCAAVLVLASGGCGPLLPDLDEMKGDGPGAKEETVVCGLHEVELPGPVCASRSRSSAAVRFATGERVAGTLWCVPAAPGAPGGRADDVAPQALHHLVVTGLAPGAAYGCAYAVTSGTGAGLILWSVELGSVDAVGGPVITEVLLNPEGSEPAQEFVEVLNPGPSPVDLAGYRLADVDPAGAEDPAEVGDPIPAGTLLGPGQLALLVAEGFSVTGPDPAPDPGCALVRLDGSLGRSGLRNSGGEPVYLVGPGGAVASLYPNALGTTGQGLSARRASVEAPCGDVANWYEGEPTPGAIE